MKDQPLKEIHVLVVDDYPANILLWDDSLTSLGAIPRLADSGRAALDLLANYTPDIILIDLAMPDMNGWELHDRLGKDPTLSGIPMIALTNSNMTGTLDRAMAAGFNDCLTKPIVSETLRDSLLSHLS